MIMMIEKWKKRLWDSCLRSAGQHLANERFRSLTCDRAPFVVLVVVVVSSVLNPPGKGLACHFKFWRVRQYVFPPRFIFLFCDDFYVFLYFHFFLNISAAVRRAPVNHQTRRRGGGGHVNYKIQRERKLVAFPPQTDRRTTQPRDDYSTCRKGKNKKRERRKRDLSKDSLSRLSRGDYTSFSCFSNGSARCAACWRGVSNGSPSSWIIKERSSLFRSSSV